MLTRYGVACIVTVVIVAAGLYARTGSIIVALAVAVVTTAALASQNRSTHMGQAMGAQRLGANQQDGRRIMASELELLRRPEVPLNLVASVVNSLGLLPEVLSLLREEALSTTP